MMRLGEVLLGQGLITAEDLETALARQRQQGGRLGNHLVAMGVLTIEQLLMALRGQKEIAATIDMCERTLLRWQALHGPSHPKTQRARYSYARALLAAGRAGEAVRYAEAALAGHRATLGENHVWTDDALQLVADARHALTVQEQAGSVAPAA